MPRNVLSRFPKTRSVLVVSLCVAAVLALRRWSTVTSRPQTATLIMLSVTGSEAQEPVQEPAAAAVPPQRALKDKLLSTLTDLNRGLEASQTDQQVVQDAAKALEAVDTAETVSRQQLEGKWRLLYSSGFAATGSLGGSRPGPPQGFLQLGPIYQVC